jgi:hypothetical protein
MPSTVVIEVWMRRDEDWDEAVSTS